MMKKRKRECKEKVLIKKIWTVKMISFSRKYIAKMFSLERFLVSEFILKLVCICEL